MHVYPKLLYRHIKTLIYSIQLQEGLISHICLLQRVKYFSSILAIYNRSISRGKCSWIKTISSLLLDYYKVVPGLLLLRPKVISVNGIDILKFSLFLQSLHLPLHLMTTMSKYHHGNQRASRESHKVTS
jgi:hypothetical protein